MKKNYWGLIIGAVAVIVIGGIIWWVAAKNKNKAEVASNNSTNQVVGNIQEGSDSPTDTTASSTEGSVGASKPKVPTNTKLAAYTDAVNKYQYRIQFAQCHGVVNTTNAGTLSIKKGVQFMLDNRDSVAHTFAFKGRSYKIEPYDFVITSATQVGSYPITCDGGGAAELNVE